jgi:tRNA(Ile2) C34 agmatinyltransferase TiaS
MKKNCPVCRSPEGVREFFYGMPNEESDSSKYVPGGCIFTEGRPDYRCIKCATDFYEDKDLFHNRFISVGSGISFQCRECKAWVPAISEIDWHECSSEVSP